MGIFKRQAEPRVEMTDPVKGSAVVELLQDDLSGGGPYSYGGLAKWKATIMRLTVSADGVAPITVEWRGQRLSRREPFPGQTIPVTVDRADPKRLSIDWTKLPTTEEALRLQQERVDEQRARVEQRMKRKR